MSILDALFGPRNNGQQAQAPGAMQQQPGFMSQLLDPSVALPMAGALLGNQGNAANFGNALSAAGPALGQQRELRAQTAKKNKTLEFLRQQSPDLAAMVDAGMPMNEAWGAYVQQRKAQTPDFKVVGDHIFNPADQSWISAPGGGALKPTAGQQDYEYAMQQLRERGVPEDKLPTYQEFAKPKSRGISFRGADGTEIQIGGEGDGTAYGGTSLPAEVGARIGLGDNFIKNDYPEVIKMIENGDATGPVDYAAGVVGRGNSGIVQRRMASGADALRRGLTGAGMSATESEEYARRYLPQPTDNAETLKLKAEGLKADLEAVTSGAIKGKAGDVGGFISSPQGSQPQGGAGMSTTSTGATWRLK